MAVTALACAAALAASGVVGPDRSESASPGDAAEAALVAWLEAYRSGDYRQQWTLTDPRIRRWHDLRRWRGWMKRAARRDGRLDGYAISGRAPAAADQLPCTEQGHCFRGGVDYVLLLVTTGYDRAAPAQPEYAVMALSSEGWRFGGGSILNRPLGETAVILTESDERRYSTGWRAGEIVRPR